MDWHHSGTKALWPNKLMSVLIWQIHMPRDTITRYNIDTMVC